MVSESDIQNASILIVDDLEANVVLLEHILRSTGYTAITTTLDPTEVYALHRNHSFDLILLDLWMPVMNGFQVMEGLKCLELESYLPVLVVTADPEQNLQALQAGARDFISIPFKVAEVRARVRNMLEVRLLQKETKNNGIALDLLNHNLQQLVREQVKEISDAHLATILSLSKIAEDRDGDTGKHIERTSELCRRLAQGLRSMSADSGPIDDEFIDDIFHASPLHDLGKVAIPDSILLKPGKLTPEEFEVIKTHTLHGAETLKTVHDRYPRNSFINMGIQIARSHHEKWDGSGYPDGLRGDAIPISAQIMAMADVYDALRNKRCYKEAFSREKSRRIILEESGRQFSPTLVEAFQRLEIDFDRIHHIR